jgi:hypothetical protein
MTRGRPRKATKRNTGGLRNQKKNASPQPDIPTQESDPETPQKRPRRVSPSPSAHSDADWDPCLAADGDSTKVLEVGGMEVVEDDRDDVEMTTDRGEAKGLKQVLEERGFDVSGMRSKCKPVCPWENSNCCMARLLSKQDDFAKQESLLEIMIRKAGHECIFLLKFHCELNPIEMVR